MAESKFRPSLTLSQLKRINELICSQDCPTTLDSSIRRTLVPFIAKAEEGIVAPAFVTRTPQSLENSLGLASAPTQNDAEQLWNLFKQGVALSKSQKLEAWGYAFSNDLLTPEQEQEYTEMLLNL